MECMKKLSLRKLPLKDKIGARHSKMWDKSEPNKGKSSCKDGSQAGMVKE